MNILAFPVESQLDKYLHFKSTIFDQNHNEEQLIDTMFTHLHLSFHISTSPIAAGQTQTSNSYSKMQWPLTASAIKYLEHVSSLDILLFNHHLFLPRNWQRRVVDLIKINDIKKLLNKIKFLKLYLYATSWYVKLDAHSIYFSVMWHFSFPYIHWCELMKLAACICHKFPELIRKTNPKHMTIRLLHPRRVRINEGGKNKAKSIILHKWWPFKTSLDMSICTVRHSEKSCEYK